MTRSSKIGRNAPCPCGSRKKYKKCCLPRDEAARIEAARIEAAQQQKPLHTNAPFSAPRVTLEEDDLDALSNSVVDMIEEGRLENAESRCQMLRERYPDTIDWLERLAMVYEAREDWAKAADYYHRAADFAESASGYEREFIEHLRQTANRIDTRAASPDH